MFMFIKCCGIKIIWQKKSYHKKEEIKTSYNSNYLPLAQGCWFKFYLFNFLLVIYAIKRLQNM